MLNHLIDKLFVVMNSSSKFFKHKILNIRIFLPFAKVAESGIAVVSNNIYIYELTTVRKDFSVQIRALALIIRSGVK